MTKEYETDEEIEILMETNATTIDRYFLESTKSKFFSSKERIAKNANDTSIKENGKLQTSKKRKSRPKTFWQIHDLK